MQYQSGKLQEIAARLGISTRVLEQYLASRGVQNVGPDSGGGTGLRATRHGVPGVSGKRAAVQ